MTSVLSRLFRSNQTPRSRPVQKAQIGLEVLEDRFLPAVSVVVSGYNMTITSDYASDTVAVRQGWRSVQPHSDGTTTYSDWGTFVTVNGKDTWYKAPRDTRYLQIFFNGNNGNDIFQNNSSIKVVAHGGAGNDTIYGGYGDNILYGDAGYDRLFGLSSKLGGYGGYGYSYGYGYGSYYRPNVNYLYGGDEGDVLYGSDANDYLDGGAGNDVLVGGGGDDAMYGRTGKDYLYGQAGNDTLNGGDDGFADYLNGGAGADKFQQEGYGNYNSYGYYYNLDHPVDFNSAEDSLFGEDYPVFTTYTSYSFYSF